jgi:hypothetical protein
VERRGIPFPNLLLILRFTALHWCIEMGSSQSLQILLQDGRINKETKDKKGRTAHQLAVEMEAEELASMLK